MNANPLFTAVLASALAVGGAFSVHATPPAHRYGEPAEQSDVTRTIVITPDTQYVNVRGGEKVKFVVGNKSFAWDFSTAQYASPFELNQIAPPGLLDHRVLTYLAPNPNYAGSSVSANFGGSAHQGGTHGTSHGGHHG